MYNLISWIIEVRDAAGLVLTIICRNLRKVNILLQAIDRLELDVEYYAVDLSLTELERTFSEIPTGKLIPLNISSLNNRVWPSFQCASLIP